MKTFRVIVSFYGSIGYDVEAETREEAEQAALDMFADEERRDVVNAIADIKASDCWEERDNAREN